MRQILLCSAAIAALALAGCNRMETPPGLKTEKDPAAFLTRAEKELSDYSEYASRVAWVNNNFITDDTDWLNTKAGSEGTLLTVRLANETKAFEKAKLTPDQKRKMDFLRAGIVMPAPSTGTPEQQKAISDELNAITTRMQSTYGKGKFTIDGKELNLEDLSNIIGDSRDPKKLQQAWEGWRTISAVPQGDPESGKPSPTMAADYTRMVEIGNQGAKELGFKDIADMWLSNYDMPSADMEATVEKLWTQVEPLYKDLHCYVRGKLNAKYGDAVQPKTGPIRADLLGNMWAQDWTNVYSLAAPPKSDPGYDLTKILVGRKFDATKMVKTGEGFYTSLGLPPLPDTFWQRSMITRPRDREVVCHASAWDIDSEDDLRIKMCTQINAEDFQTVHHELGHNYYQRAY